MPVELAHQFIEHSLTQDTRLAASITNGNIDGIIQIFKEWDSTPPYLPYASKTVIDALQKIDVQFSDTELSMLKMASLLATEENKNPYHGNTHFLKVFTLSALLGADAFKDNRISAHHLCILLSSALLHDYKHDGTNNKGQRYRLENLSLDSSESMMKKAGATEDDWELFKAFIHTTDVSKDFSDPSALSPAETVKKYSTSNNPDDLLPELRVLAATGTADIALMLEDADLSGGLIDIELNVQTGLELAREQGRIYEASSQKFFLEHICHKQVFSISGLRLIQPRMNEVMTHYGLQPIPQGLTMFPA
jgi:hypothetical protein